MNAWRRQGWLMTAHTQPERRPESEPGFDEAKVRRIICVVVSIIAVSAGSLIGTAEPSKRRVGATIPVIASTRMAVAVPHLPESGRSHADTWHKSVAKTPRFRARPENVVSTRTIVDATRPSQDALARVAQARALPEPAD